MKWPENHHMFVFQTGVHITDRKAIPHEFYDLC